MGRKEGELEMEHKGACRHYCVITHQYYSSTSTYESQGYFYEAPVVLTAVRRPPIFPVRLTYQQKFEVSEVAILPDLMIGRLATID